LGVVIFSSASIESVEVVGQMQTVYMVDDDIDYEEAKLKVTYKNGNIRMIDMNSSGVKVELFSTSIEKHGKLNIVYKGFVNSVEYDVLNKGCYFTQSTTTERYDSSSGGIVTSSSPTYTKDTTSSIVYLDSNGVVKYYQKIDDKWYMNDGNYDSSFNYSITGSTINVNIGSDTKLALNVNYEKDINNNSKLYLSSTSETKTEDGNFLISKTTTVYGWYNMKTNRSLKEPPEVDLSKTDSVSDPNVNNGNAYVVFKRGQNIESSGKEIYIKVTIANDEYLPVVYVRVTDKMVSRNSLKTSNITDASFALLYYESRQFYLYYSVV
jgi:hypothetical protein